MSWFWHRLLVRLGLRKNKPFVLTPEMIARIGMKSLENNRVWQFASKRREL